MTTATALAPRTVAGGYTHTLRTFLTGFGVLGLWACATLAVLWVGVALVADRMGTPVYSIAQFARQGLVWFPFSLVLVALGSHVAAHLAAGMTRRVLADAAISSAVVMSVAYTAVLVLAMQVERGFYARVGWAHGLSDDWSLPTRSDQVGLLAVDVGLLILAGHLCALLVWVVYRRAGGWWGTLALPLTAGPILAVAPALRLTAVTPALRVLLVLVVLAAVAVVFRRLAVGVQLTKVEQ